MTSNRCPECGGRLKVKKLKDVSQQERKFAIPVSKCKKCGRKYIKVRRRWQCTGREPVEKKEDE